MSGYQASCPSCGDTVVFSLGQSLLKVCESCGSAVARQGAKLESYGKVADLIPTPSVLKLGIEGRYPGAPGFRLVGRLQLDHGSGTWDEWLLGFDNDQWAWLAESQGKFHYMGRAALPPVREFARMKPGASVDLGPAGVFVVTEVKTAQFVTAQGELPFDVRPGSALHYVDLSGPDGQFATIDYGTGSGAEALYVGRAVTLDQLGIREIASAEERRKRVQGGQIACPQCGGPLEIRAPDQTQRVACPWCGSLLDATNDLAILQALNQAPVKPDISLGTKGRIGRATWTVIGFMVRSVEYEGIRYGWHEYLLYEPRKGFRWLTNNNGHWSFVEPAHAGDVRDVFSGTARYAEQRYRHFQSAEAQVDHVVGEFYWAVARGDKTRIVDYVAPPYFLSKESTPSEDVWSRGEYMEPGQIWETFRLQGEPPEPTGVAPNQVWKWKKDARGVYASALMFAGLILFGYVVLLALGGSTVHTESFTIPPNAAPGSAEATVFTQPFEIPRSGNVQIRAKAPVMNSWLYLDGALIEESSGDFHAFDIEVSYYTGRDSDGVWTEGSDRRTTYLGSVPPGRYVLRLSPQWEQARVPQGYEIRVRSRVPRFYQAFLALLAVGFWPVMVAWRQFRFEMARWSESDHAWTSE